MIVMSFRTKKDKEHMLKKAKEMEAYVAELVDCLEDADPSEEYEDMEYSERGSRMYRGGMSMRGGRYGYNR